MYPVLPQQGHKRPVGPLGSRIAPNLSLPIGSHHPARYNRENRAMSLAPGTRLGPYEVLSLIGASTWSALGPYLRTSRISARVP
jgi:hypothetical protein